MENKMNYVKAKCHVIECWKVKKQKKSAENFAHQLRDFMYWDLIIYMNFSEKQNYFIKRHAVLVCFFHVWDRDQSHIQWRQNSHYMLAKTIWNIKTGA